MFHVSSSNSTQQKSNSTNKSGVMTTWTRKRPLDWLYLHCQNVLVMLLFTLIWKLQVVCCSEAILSLGPINVMVLTDVHSWVAGHLPHEPEFDADYGDVLSFYERLKSKCVQEQKDLFFVMNGDFIDGTGLSTNPPQYLTPILRNMPWDAINIGNHELYKNSTIEFISKDGGFVDFWEGRYLTSNVLNESGNPIGERYRFLHAPFTNKTILTFGFLYDFQNNCPITTIESVSEIVNSDWFTNVLLDGNFDAIMVLAHMGYDDPLVDILLDRIRLLCGSNMPVQFITGHTHIRANRQIDTYSSSFEAGRYLDTIGLVSFPTKIISDNALPSSTTTSDQLPLEFRHTFINTTVNTMKTLLGVETLKTENGLKLTNLIRNTQDQLGLLRVLGCAPMTFELDNTIDESNSLWGLYLNEVIPDQLFESYGNEKNIYIQGEGAFRYNLFQGNVSVTDLISASPYNDTVYLLDNTVDGNHILNAFGDLNGMNDNNPYSYLRFAGVQNFSADDTYRVFVAEFDLFRVKSRLETISERIFVPEKLNDITTGILWEGYINRTWICSVKNNEEGETSKPKDFLQALSDFFDEFTALKVIAFVLTFIIVIVFGWMFICRSHTTGIYSYGSQSGSEEDSYVDNISFDEFSSSGTSHESSSIYLPKMTSSPPQVRSKKKVPPYHSFNQHLDGDII